MTLPASDDDPFVVLGLTRAASLDDVRAARRRLARDLHPDVGGDGPAMQRVNLAFDRAVGHLTGRRPLDDAPAAPTSRRPTPPRPAPATRPEPAGPVGRAPFGGRRRRGWVEHDTPSFTIDALPAEAFEALLVVASWIGEVLDDDPPYVLECVLGDPVPCWCRLELVPDAGGSTVSLIVAAVDPRTVDDDDPPAERVSAEAVRDVWVDQLNRLGRADP